MMDEINAVPLMSADNPEKGMLDKVVVHDGKSGHEEGLLRIKEGDLELPIQVQVESLSEFNRDRDVRDLFVMFMRLFGYSIHNKEQNKPLNVNDIVWEDEEEPEIVITPSLPVDLEIIDSSRDEVVNLDEYKIEFAIWSAEQNQLGAQLFFTNLRRNILAMTKRTMGPDATIRHTEGYYLDGEYADVFDLLMATADWGVPMVIHRPGNHASLVLKNAEFDQGQRKWKVLVYDPMAGGEQYKWLEKVDPDGGPEDDIVSILEVISTPTTDSPLDEPQAYDLYENNENINAVRLWSSGKYDLSVATDEYAAREDSLDMHMVEEKQKKVQFDANNCVLASAYMAVIRAFLRYPELFDMKKRALIYQDTGIIFHTRDEVLRKKIPPTAEELMAVLEKE